MIEFYPLAVQIPGPARKQVLAGNLSLAHARVLMGRKERI